MAALGLAGCGGDGGGEATAPTAAEPPAASKPPAAVEAPAAGREAGAPPARPSTPPAHRPPSRPQPPEPRPAPRLRPARCPAGVPGCRVATGRVVYVERVDPDGDGDAHFVILDRQGITLPGLTAIDVRAGLRPRPLPGVGTLISAAGPVQTGSYGQRQIHALELRVAGRARAPRAGPAPAPPASRARAAPSSPPAGRPGR